MIGFRNKQTRVHPKSVVRDRFGDSLFVDFLGPATSKFLSPLEFVKCIKIRSGLQNILHFFFSSPQPPTLSLSLSLSIMQHIDRDQLYTDSAYRFEYVAKFMDFGKLACSRVLGIFPLLT